MRLCSIASGSSGNCIYAGSESTHLLIDAGISKKRIVEGLESIDINPEELSGIFVTHEHTDHISGLGVMMRTFKVPVYATVETINAILHYKNIGRVDTELFRPIQANESVEIGDVVVNPFSISHDASNPVCYTINDGKSKIGVATDLGVYDEYIIENLQNSSALLLEANHDVNMLHVGPYPYYLKQRILGNKGHLSNENSGKLISKITGDKLKYIFLGHLSKENNYPELAYETVLGELKKEVPEHSDKLTVSVAFRDKPSKLVVV